MRIERQWIRVVISTLITLLTILTFISLITFSIIKSSNDQEESLAQLNVADSVQLVIQNDGLDDSITKNLIKDNKDAFSKFINTRESIELNDDTNIDKDVYIEGSILLSLHKDPSNSSYISIKEGSKINIKDSVIFSNNIVESRNINLSINNSIVFVKNINSTIDQLDINNSIIFITEKQPTSPNQLDITDSLLTAASSAKYSRGDSVSNHSYIDIIKNNL